jgi:fructokinase
MAYHIVGIGEILWDVFPDERRFGGAPANFACSAAELAQDGANVFMVSAVGDDDLGREAIGSLALRGVRTSSVQVNRQPTGRVDVELDEAGVASYRFADDSAWDHLAWNDELQRLAARCDAVCFGTLGQRGEMSQQTIRTFIGNVPASALRILDVNLRKPFYNDDLIVESLKLANVLKLNDEELPLVARLSDCTGDAVEVMQQLARQYELRLVALTRGPAGAVLMSGNEVSDLPGVPVDVVDTVGAGDAFTASMTLDLLAGRRLEDVNKPAIATASHVCSQPGATMPFPDHLRK